MVGSELIIFNGTSTISNTTSTMLSNGCRLPYCKCRVQYTTQKRQFGLVLENVAKRNRCDNRACSWTVCPGFSYSPCFFYPTSWGLYEFGGVVSRFSAVFVLADGAGGRSSVSTLQAPWVESGKEPNSLNVTISKLQRLIIHGVNFFWHVPFDRLSFHLQSRSE